MPKLVIYFPKQVLDALRMLAEREYRDPRSQAALIIRDELNRMGLLEATGTETDTNDVILPGVVLQ